MLGLAASAAIPRQRKLWDLLRYKERKTRKVSPEKGRGIVCLISFVEINLSKVFFAKLRMRMLALKLTTRERNPKCIGCITIMLRQDRESPSWLIHS